MPILPYGSFDRATQPQQRRGLNGTGLAGIFGQSPAQRRMLSPLGGSNAFGGPLQGRSDFSGGVLGGTLRDPAGNPFGGRGNFGRGSSALNFEDVTFRNPMPGTPAYLTAQSSMGSPGGTGSVGTPGGKWAPLDAYNSAISSAASKWGVDPNRLKAHMMIESGGNPAAVQNNPTNGNTYGLMQINPAIWSAPLKAAGIDMFTPEGNIEGAAWILADLEKRYGSWDAASSAYFTGGPNWQGVDTVNGTTGDDYRSALNGYIEELNQAGGSWSTGAAGKSGNAVVDLATQYVGVRYQWASVPGANVDPWQTGWDCSGMIKWLSDKMGGGVPAGSHYQYQWAQQTGRLTMNTSQLKPGDLLFFDTGSRAGGGAGMNAASHVGMYIGNGQLIHAANESVGTIISSLSDPYYAGNFIGAASMDWSGGSGVPAGATGVPGGTGGSPLGTIQANNGAYYTPGYVIPTRLRR